MTMNEPLSISETFVLLEWSTSLLGGTIDQFVVPTTGATASLDDVIEQCDGIIDLCVLIIQKAQMFDDIRSGRDVNGVI